MQNTIVVNCRNFACLNNKSGECLLAKISLQSDGTSLVSKVVCIEAENKPDSDIGSASPSSSPERRVADTEIADKG